MQIDTVVYYCITDPKLYTYGVERPVNAIENLTATTLRNLIGELELDETLTSRDTINQQMRSILDEATDPWGIKVNRVELKNILPPRDIQEAMEKQMRAEREKREAILRADGEKQAAILSAEGEKEAAILRADAQKITVVKEAEGRAEALLRVAEAQAQSIKMINDANPNAAYVTLKGYESLEKVAEGNATKIIVPSNLQDVSGLAASVKAVLENDKPSKK
jgi:regulator of protease activity HflC (stomatin/prohibitin superfamily)